MLVSYLRPYDNRQPDDYLKFDRFYSMGEWKENRKIGQIKELIKEKTTKDNLYYRKFI